MATPTLSSKRAKPCCQTGSDCTGWGLATDPTIPTRHQIRHAQNRSFTRSLPTQGKHKGRKTLGKETETYLKDADWMTSGRKLILTPDDTARFKMYLEKDVALLQRLKLMNYSLDVR